MNRIDELNFAIAAEKRRVSALQEFFEGQGYTSRTASSKALAKVVNEKADARKREVSETPSGFRVSVQRLDALRKQSVAP